MGAGSHTKTWKEKKHSLKICWRILPLRLWWYQECAGTLRQVADLFQSGKPRRPFAWRGWGPKELVRVWHSDSGAVVNVPALSRTAKKRKEKSWQRAAKVVSQGQIRRASCLYSKQLWLPECLLCQYNYTYVLAKYQPQNKALQLKALWRRKMLPGFY